MRKLLGLVPVLFCLGAEAQLVPLFPAASDVRQGFLRVVNPHGLAGDVTVIARTAGGERRETAFSFARGEVVKHFTSDDLEYGNSMKGITGIGSRNSDWHLTLSSPLSLVVPAYMRTKTDGFLTSLHDVVPREADNTYRLHIFNPASNENQRSILRLVNLRDDTATVTVTGTDDTGEAGVDTVTVTVPGNGAASLSAQQLEDRGLGDGTGKWRLTVTAVSPIIVMNLMETPAGHLTNLSTAPAVAETLVPFFPRASENRQGFIRIINETDGEQTVTVTAYDSPGFQRQPFTLTLAPNTVLHFNADHLEQGNPRTGIPGIGTGTGDWYLTVTGEVRVLTFMRTKTDGFLTSLHDVVPQGQVATFNPASNENQRSILRAVKPGTRGDWSIVLYGRDDAGVAGEQGFDTHLSQALAYTFDAQRLEAAFGNGRGKWRLRMLADYPAVFMNLMETPTGHLTNLSTVPGAIAPFPTGTHAGQGALLERIAAAGGHKRKVVVWELAPGRSNVVGHAANMRSVILNEGVPAANIAVPGPLLTDASASAVAGVLGFLHPSNAALRAETLVVTRSVHPSMGTGDADRIRPLNLVWVAGVGDDAAACITDRDYWHLANIAACGWRDEFYYAMLNALETGKALITTAARRMIDGTVVPHDGVYKCGDLMAHCVTVPGVGHASGAAAIVSAAAFHLFQTYEDAGDVVAALKRCTEDIGEPGIDREFGLGIVDFRCADAMLPVIDR